MLCRHVSRHVSRAQTLLMLAAVLRRRSGRVLRTMTSIQAIARHMHATAETAGDGESGPVTDSSESFIDRAKRMGASALLGSFINTGVRFDRVLQGMEITRLDSSRGEVECELDVGESVCNAYGTLHGGCVTTLVDVVGTLAILAQDPTRAGVSVEISTSFMTAAEQGDRVRCVGKLLKGGKRLAFTQVDLYRKSDGKLIASGRHTKHL